MKRNLITGFLMVALIATMGSFTPKPKKNLSKDYVGKPFQDEVYKSGAQTIPGRVLCALFDLGGEGVVYQDSDSIINGSGSYNRQPGYCEKR